MSDVDAVLNKIEAMLKPDFLVAELSVDGLDTGPVLKVFGEEALSNQFKYDVEVELDGPPPDLSFVIGAAAKLTVRDATGNDRIVVGIVADILARSFDADTHRAEIVIKPKVYRQNLGRDCFAMQEVNSVDIIKEVLDDYPGKVRYELTRDYPHYPYRAQYREDDWTYVSRLAEEEGIYYWFDHEGDDSTVVFADNSTSAPSIEGIPVLNFADPSAMRPDQEAVVEVSFEAKMTATKFAGRSFDPDRPLLRIEASDGEGHREEYDAPGAGPVEPSVLKFRIKNANEAAKAAKAGIGGVATSARLTPGRTFTLIGHPMSRFTDDFLVTSMTLEATMKRPAVVRFKAIPKSVPFRPLRTTPVAKQAGLQMGQVVGPDGQEVHPDQRGRVRSQLHWDRLGKKNETSGTWMRIDQRGAPGSMLLPRMGWNVATFNDEGGVDAPAILCRIHDADHPPEYELPAHKTRVVWKTKTTPQDGTHEIRFEDAAGMEEMFINASKDFNQRTRNKKTETVGGNHTLTVGNDYQLHVDNTMTSKVNQDQKIDVKGDEKVDVLKNYSIGSSANQKREISGDRTITAGDSISINVIGKRELTVDGSMTEVSLGDVESHVTKNSKITVEGTLERVAEENITDAADKKFVQKIKQDKIELCENGERTSNVTKTLKETVKGSINITTNNEFVDNADEQQKITVQKAMNGKAPDVWIEAVKEIRVKCGTSVITLTTDRITFEGTNLDLSGMKTDSDTGQIKHNV